MSNFVHNVHNVRFPHFVQFYPICPNLSCAYRLKGSILFLLKIQLFFFSDGKNCKTCERILSILETQSVELEEAGIEVVRINDKKTSKSYGILSAPGLTYFKGGKGENFEGELTDAETLMDFLASPEAMELPDQIEEVNAKQLDKLVVEKMFVAVLFCKYFYQNSGFFHYWLILIFTFWYIFNFFHYLHFPLFSIFHFFLLFFLHLPTFPSFHFFHIFSIFHFFHFSTIFRFPTIFHFCTFFIFLLFSSFLLLTFPPYIFSIFSIFHFFLFSHFFPFSHFIPLFR